MKKRLFWLFGILLAFIPIGLITDTPAWGEWGKKFYQKKLGFIPKGIENAKDIFTLFPDYSLPGHNLVFGYYLSAIIGSLAIMSIFYILAKIKKQ